MRATVPIFPGRYRTTGDPGENLYRIGAQLPTMTYEEFLQLGLANKNGQQLGRVLFYRRSFGAVTATYEQSRSDGGGVLRITGVEPWRIRCRHTGDSGRSTIFTMTCDLYNPRNEDEIQYQRKLPLQIELLDEDGKLDYAHKWDAPH